MAKRTEIYLAKKDQMYLDNNAREHHRKGYPIRQVRLFGTWVPVWVINTQLLTSDLGWATVECYTLDGKKLSIHTAKDSLKLLDEYPDPEEPGT